MDNPRLSCLPVSGLCSFGINSASAIIHKLLFYITTRIFQEYANTGAGSSTSARVNETALTAAIVKTAVLGSAWESWTDTTY